MEHSIIQLSNLPDELLMMIFKKLNSVQLLNSLMGLDTRLDRILSDSIFIKDLTLCRYFSNDRIFPLVDTMLDRFCFEILPQIHNKINSLNLESSSMERILLSADYSNLYGLVLFNIDEKSAERLFTNESPLFNIFNKKMKSLVITLIDNRKEISQEDFVRIFTWILTVFVNLNYFNCDTLFKSGWRRLSFVKKSPIFFSSTLSELHINVSTIEDCLYLLDGRLNELRRLFVNVHLIYCDSTTVDPQKRLPNLKCFSLTSKSEGHYYKKLIVPLLRRMVNLEELGLFICVDQQKIVDGNVLKSDINNLSQLNKFIFNVRSIFRVRNPTDLVSNEDIQNTLTGLGENQVISYVDYFQKNKQGQCHYFSYPYTLKYYDDITNRFPGGLFKCVREVTLYDERPFEHEFFLRIAHAFPLVEILSLTNDVPQQLKLINNDKHLSIVEYSHLKELFFNGAHDDYIEQFLVNTKTFLPKTLHFWGDYPSLKRVTNNFTRKTTRINCAKIKHLHLFGRFDISKHLTNYFPNAKM